MGNMDVMKIKGVSELKYSIGDKVKVIDEGKVYGIHNTFIEKYKPNLLKKWKLSTNTIAKGIYKIVFIKHDEKYTRDTLVIIENENYVYVISAKGLELVKPQLTLSDLKERWLVELRNGELRIILSLYHNQITSRKINKDYNYILDNETYVLYNEDLTHKTNRDLDIISASKPHYTEIYKREEIKKVTMAEVYEKFGEVVEIEE